MITLQEKLAKAQQKTKWWAQSVEINWPAASEWERIQKIKETKRLRENNN